MLKHNGIASFESISVFVDKNILQRRVDVSSSVISIHTVDEFFCPIHVVVSILKVGGLLICHSVETGAKGKDLVHAPDWQTLDEELQRLFRDIHFLSSHRATPVNYEGVNVLRDQRGVDIFLLDFFFIVNVIDLLQAIVLRLLSFKCRQKLCHHGHVSLELIRSLVDKPRVFHIQSPVIDMDILLKVSIVALNFLDHHIILTLLKNLTIVRVRYFEDWVR